MKKDIISLPVCVKTLGWLLLAGWVGTLAAWAEDVVILKGSSARRPVAEGIKKITVGNPAIADARPTEDGRAVLVNGLAEGVSVPLSMSVPVPITRVGRSPESL